MDAAPHPTTECKNAQRPARAPERAESRLAALGRYGLLDTPPEQSFDDLTRLAAQVCRTPFAMLSLVDGKRAWFKSGVGTPLSDIPRDCAFCSHVVTSGEALLIRDALKDARFAGNPFVTGEPHLRFYAGAPLVTPDGHVLGTLSVTDTRPRMLSAPQREALAALARQAVAQMELCRAVAEGALAEAQRRRSEEQYRSIFENAAEGIFQTVPGGGFAGANPALARMLGYDSPADLLASVHDVGAQIYADPSERAELLRRFYTEGVVSGFELQVRRKDGTRLWASLSARAVRDTSTGQLLYVEGSAVDVTDRRRAEDRLRQMAAIVESSHEAIISKTLDDVVLSWNSGAQRLYGYSAQEAVGRRFADLAPPAVQTAGAGTLLDRVLAGESVSQVETARLDRYGSRVEVSVSLWPVRDAQGRIQAISSIAHNISEQKRSQEALRERERQLQTVADNVPSLIARVDAALRYRFCNRAYCTYIGCAPEQVIGRFMADVLGPETFESLRPYTERTLVGEALTYQATVPYPKVGPRTMQISYVPERDSDGAVAGFVLSATDITERQAADDALRESEERLQLALQAGGMGTWDSDFLSKRTVVSDGLAALYGRSPQNLGGFLDCVHPDDRAALLQKVSDPSRAEFADEYRVVWPDGTERWMAAKGRVMRDSSGRPVRVTGAVVDITERRRTEAALRDSDLRFRSAFDDAPIGMCLVDTGGGFLQVNRALCELVGYAEDELLATGFPAITHPEDVEADLHQHREMLAGRIRGYAMEKRYVHRAGHTVWVQISVSLIRDAEGRPRHSIAQIQDITQRRALEAQQERLLAEALARADRDPLTGLLNHRAFHKRLDEECERAQQSGGKVAVVMLDLDNFKFFNDSYGHLAGDEVLRRVALTLTEVCRPGDTVARFGGDEFALLLPGLDGHGTGGVVAHLKARLDERVYRPEGADVAVPLALCAGVAVWPQEVGTRLEAVERADERLRRAKSGADDLEADAIRLHMGRSLEGFSMLDALVTAVDNKDRYTRRHSEDVLTYSLEIAAQLGLGERARHTVAVAALLHDVGKIGVPDRVLRKPGRLTEEEFAAVKQHPMMGAVIVGAVPGLEETLDAVRHHHERWDGGGYPFGLRGEECPLVARLMAVADAFSAMTTDRPYRKGMPHEKALGILRDGAGTQWDPQCVAAFLRARRGGLLLAA